MPRFRLLDVDGNDLGPFVASTPTWSAGDIIPRGPGDRLEVVNIVEPESSSEAIDGYLIVRPA